MYTSDTERAPLKRKRSRRALKSAGRYLLASAVCMAIGVTYEYFSHDVWSVYMLFAFAVPLLAGALPAFTAWLLKLPEPAPSAEAVYACGMITLTAGSFLHQEDAEAWREMVQEAFPDQNVRYDPLSLSISVHTGPDSYGCAASILYER